MKRTMYRLLCFAPAVVATIAAGATYATAHDPGLSTTTIVVSADALVATIRMHNAELADLDATAIARVLSHDPATSPLVVRIDGNEWKASHITSDREGHDETTIEVTFPRPTASVVEVDVTLLASLPRGHKHHLEVRDRDGTVLATSILSATAATLRVTLGPGAAAAGAPDRPRLPVRPPT